MLTWLGILAQSYKIINNVNASSKWFSSSFSTAARHSGGVIEKGNTQIIAEMIAEQTGADTFSIERAVAYPTTYDGLLEVSREEESNPPEIAGTVENMDDYSVIFIGFAGGIIGLN